MGRQMCWMRRQLQTSEQSTAWTSKQLSHSSAHSRLMTIHINPWQVQGMAGSGTLKLPAAAGVKSPTEQAGPRGGPAATKRPAITVAGEGCGLLSSHRTHQDNGKQPASVTLELTLYCVCYWCVAAEAVQREQQAQPQPAAHLLARRPHLPQHAYKQQQHQHQH